MDYTHTVNQCLAAPGLAINASGSATVKYANTFTFKAGGLISPSITTATCPSLALATLTAPFPNRVAAVAGSLATGYSRTYALIGTLTGSETAPTFSWLAGPDVVNTGITDVSTSGFPSRVSSLDCVIGWVNVSNASPSTAFTPGTTALNAASVTTTYIDNYAISGK